MYQNEQFDLKILLKEPEAHRNAAGSATQWRRAKGFQKKQQALSTEAACRSTVLSYQRSASLNKNQSRLSKQVFSVFVILSKCPLNRRCSKIMRATTVYESNINRDIPCLPQELLTELFKLSYHHFSLSICKLEQLVSKWLTLLSAY